MPEMSAQTRARLASSQSQVKRQAVGRTDTAHGSADWASPEEMMAASIVSSRVEDAKPFFFGQSSQGYLSYNGDGHCLTFGPTGSGKAVSVVVPNLLNYPGSVVCIDPKGAIAPITAARRRAMGQKVILLDPFEEVERAMQASGRPDVWQPIERNSYNPLSELDPNSKTIIEDVRLFASGIIMEEEGRNRYFSDCARIVTECLLLHLISCAPRDGWTIKNLFDLASRPRHVFENKLLPDMQERGAFDGHVARLGQQIVGYSTEGGASILTTLHRSLNLLNSPALSSILQKSDVDFYNLKDQPTTVYLTLPANRLHTHSLWLRLMLSSIINQLSDARSSPYPVLFLIDECATLGRLEILETAVGLMRGYGMKMWLIFQDLPQLQGIYKERWSSFISNSGIKQFFNVNDTITADFVSSYLDKQTIYTRSESISAHGQLPGSSYAAIGRPLLFPDEVRRMDKKSQILFYEGLRPVHAKKVRYFENDELQGLAAPDPYIGA